MNYSDWPQTVSEKRVKARKDYFCVTCREPMPKGSLINTQTISCDGHIYTWRMCDCCRMITSLAECDPESPVHSWPEDWMQHYAEKIKNKHRIGQLMVAGAFIAAEIDRLLAMED